MASTRQTTRVQILATITLLTALFSVGWFGILAIVAAVVDLPNPAFWLVGLLIGSLCFGTFVTALREGGARQLIETLRRARE